MGRTRRSTPRCLGTTNRRLILRAHLSAVEPPLETGGPRGPGRRVERDLHHRTTLVSERVKLEAGRLTERGVYERAFVVQLEHWGALSEEAPGPRSALHALTPGVSRH